MICLNHLMFKIGKILPSEGFKNIWKFPDLVKTTTEKLWFILY